jgi:PAS domain S-box-containing protein
VTLKPPASPPHGVWGGIVQDLTDKSAEELLAAQVDAKGPKGPGAARAWRSQWPVYALAGLAAAAPLCLCLALGFKIGDQPALILFLIPILLVAYAGGPGPALFSTGVAAVLTDYFFLPPPRSLSLVAELHNFEWMTLLGTGVLTSVLVGRLRQSRDEAEARAKLQMAMLASIGDAVITTDLEGNISYLNPAAERLTAWKNQDAQGRRLTAVLPIVDAETRQPPKDLVKQALDGGVGDDMSKRLLLVSQDGREMALTQSAAPIRQTDGTVAGVALAFQDRSAQKLAEQSLRESEALLRLVMDLVPHFIFAKDRESRHLFVNRACANASGMTPEQMVGRRDLDFVPDRAQAEAFMRDDQEVLASGKPKFNPEERLTDATGRIRILQTTKIPFAAPGTGEPAILGVAVDITGRKWAEEELEKERTLLRTLIDAAPDLIFAKDTEARFTICNRACLACVGLTRESEMAGKSVIDISQQPLAQAHYEDDLKVLRHGETIYNREEQILDAAGREEWYLTIKTPLRNRKGQITGLVGISRNIQARKEAERAIRELNNTLEQRVKERTADLQVANQELEAFCYSVSHDLRAPLRAIHGFARALADSQGQNLEPAGRSHLNRVLAAADRMGQLIDDLLNLSRITRSDFARRPVDLSSLARTIAEELRQREPLRSVEFIVADQIMVNGDSRLLRILLENLLGNAWKFTSKKPAARIELGVMTDHDGRAVCFVRDNGAGFDTQYAQKLFGAFQRLHTMEEFPGTGIGLATVQRIILRHHGRVWADAKVEEGANFYFTLGEPVAAESLRVS